MQNSGKGLQERRHYGDYLLSEDRVDQEEYARKQIEAKEYLMKKAWR